MRNTASFGIPCTVFPLIPVSVCPANNALMIASSVASIVAASRGLIVTSPTVTPGTSVIALYTPGLPSNGTPKSRARFGPCALPESRINPQPAVRIIRTIRILVGYIPIRNGQRFADNGQPFVNLLACNRKRRCNKDIVPPHERIHTQLPQLRRHLAHDRHLFGFSVEWRH